jgi:hypothetical protein
LFSVKGAFITECDTHTPAPMETHVTNVAENDVNPNIKIADTASNNIPCILTVTTIGSSFAPLFKVTSLLLTLIT